MSQATREEAKKSLHNCVRRSYWHSLLEKMMVEHGTDDTIFIHKFWATAIQVMHPDAQQQVFPHD